ncbi:hypothetical protein [Bacillus salipaludis]|uniref:hypothetical protein n=1 Tax=Bacillus salipaludis TaxID=2547811 RepID=UPI002E1F5B59|nr:hypothetical protein [Bacillus salipaludis]
MERIPVVFKGKDYFMIFQYSSGYCEIVEEGEPNHNVKLVHFSELTLKRSMTV